MENCIHRTVYETLRKEILLGTFNERAKFPSEQQLCRRFAASRGTIRLALGRLKDSGLLETRNGSGTYLSATAHRCSGSIGLIVPDIATGEIFPPICEEIVRSARDEGYHVISGNASSADPAVRSRQALDLADEYVAKKVSGVILEPIELTPDAPLVTKRIVRTLADHGIQTVLIDRDIVASPDRSPFDLVGIDNFRVGGVLARHLLAHGAKRICCYTRPGSAPTVALRFAGAREVLLESGHPAPRICSADPNDFAAITKLFSGKNPPDAVLCGNDLSANVLLGHLRKLKLNVPRDVLIAGVDDVRAATESHPPLTTMRQPVYEIGRLAVKTLLERLRDPSLPPRQILLDPVLIERKSTRVRPA